MAQIKNIDGLTSAELKQQIANGGKFVQFEYCISIFVMTFKRGSDIYFIKAGDSSAKHSISFTLLSCVFGWWGIPWGPIYTIGALATNIGGGKDLTNQVVRSINLQ